MLDFQSALYRLRQFLKENELRFTNERQTILQEICQFTNHFDAEKLFIQIRKKHHRDLETGLEHQKCGTER